MTYKDPEKQKKYAKEWREKNKEKEKKRLQKYYQENKEKIKKYQEKNKEKKAKYAKEWREKNLERTKKQQLEYRQENKEKIAKQRKKYKQENKEKVRKSRQKYYQKNKKEILKKNHEYVTKRRKTDIGFKIKTNLRHRFNIAIKNYKKSDSILKLCGCTIPELKEYLESQFQEGMTWENWSLDGWHIDHIKPCASFNLTNEDEQKKCFHYTNLQPLWAKDNLSKGAKI